MTETWNEGNPIITNQVANDVPDIEENLSYLLAMHGYRVDSSEADQGAAGSGNSIKDLVDAIGSSKNATLFLQHHAADGNTTTYTVTTSETIPSNIAVVCQPGVRLDGAGTLTINGPFEAGLYQVFGSSITIEFGTSSVIEVYPEWWGAVGDGTTDCQAAYTAAVAACRAGSTIRISSGKFKLASNLAIDKRINLQGVGTDSIIWLTMGTSVDGITVGNASTYTNGLMWKDFSILGGASACKNGLILKKVNGSHFKNIHIWPGTAGTGAAVWIQWAITCRYNFVISGIHDYTETGSTPVHGVKVSESDDTATTCNICEFDLDVNVVSGKGLYIFTSGDNGNNSVRGLFEACTDYGVHIEGGKRVHLHDIHSETGVAINRNEIVIEDHQYAHIGPGVNSFSYGTGYNDVQLINADKTTIDGLFCNRLAIDSDSNYTALVSATYQGQTDNGLYDSSTTTTQTNTHIPQYGAWKSAQGAPGGNLLTNGTFERWTTTSTAPPGWSYMGTDLTWAREGTIVKDGTYSLKAVTNATTDIVYAEVDTAQTTAIPDYCMISVGGWIYIPTSGGQDVAVWAYWELGAAETTLIDTITTRDAWVRVNFSYLAKGLANDRTYSRICFIVGGAVATYYLDGWSAVAAVGGGQVAYAPNAGEFPVYTGTDTWDPASIAADAQEAKDFVCPGAALGMVANVGAGVDVTDLIVSATVTAANTVTVVLHNDTAGAIDLASSTWNVSATKLF